ncbi:MAG: Cellulosome-anchoring protein precursor, partial [Verrucomicrobiota bacterium]
MFFTSDTFRFTFLRALAGLCGFFLLEGSSADAAAPTDILLSNTVIRENDPDRNFIGKLTVVDADADDEFTYYLAWGEGGGDRNSFAVNYDQLLLSYGGGGPDGPVLDFEKQTTYYVRVGVQDSTQQFYEKSFVITMIDDNGEDEDRDGLIESAEEALGLNDKKVDSDGDGFSDPLEIQLGSLPTDVNDWPDHPLVGWGGNSYGELMVPAAADFGKLSTGQNHSLGLKFNGTIAAWAGWNEYGQLIVPSGLNQVVEVAAGGDFWAEDSSHSLALKADGTVVGWGYDDEEGTHVPPAGLAGVVE